MALRPAIPPKPTTDVLILEIAADHIRRFWEPRMRRRLLEVLDQPEAAGP